MQHVCTYIYVHMYTLQCDTMMMMLLNECGAFYGELLFQCARFTQRVVVVVVGRSLTLCQTTCTRSFVCDCVVVCRNTYTHVCQRCDDWRHANPQRYCLQIYLSATRRVQTMHAHAYLFKSNSVCLCVVLQLHSSAHLQMHIYTHTFCQNIMQQRKNRTSGTPHKQHKNAQSTMYTSIATRVAETRTNTHTSGHNGHDNM